ncbi:MAG: hypothetical protein C5B54_04905 [Acidobacteria bacterium]|nr:MAG: hypothetical protein C5B54_04905 [Acidobacteriota bacterium]
MNPIIQIQEVHKSFGSKHVLNGISGTIQQGKVVGLLGRNGEGKTTLFRAMLDIISIDSGRVSISGFSPNGSGKTREFVGYVPERPAFHHFMTAEDVLHLRSEFFPKWRWDKAFQIAKELELDLKTHIKGASKGTLAKIAWVCATAHDPEVLLLDEPTSGLDLLVRDSVLQHLVSELSQEGRTIFVANHRMEELLGILDEVWLLQNGRILEVYSIDDLREHACRINGRLRTNGSVPPSVVEEQRTGDLVTWLVLNRDTFENIRQQQLLDSMERQPLPIETTFKLLLARKGENV